MYIQGETLINLSYLILSYLPNRVSTQKCPQEIGPNAVHKYILCDVLCAVVSTELYCTESLKSSFYCKHCLYQTY